MGKSNYIASVLVPIFAIVNHYLKKYNKPIIQFGYTVLMAVAVLATGSKLGLFMFGLCVIIELLQSFSHSHVSRKLFRGLFVAFLVIVAVLFVISRYKTELFQVAMRFLLMTFLKIV